jgi:hypothetical protein
LIPFAKECQKDRPNTIVQEDNAAPHAYHAQAEVYSFHSIERLLWPSNSPDLNMIEPCWMWLKRHTTIRGAPANKKTARAVWLQTWKDLPQEHIQHWIERIMHHIQEVIRLEGGNEYKEGRITTNSRSWKNKRIKGQLSRRALWEDVDEAIISNLGNENSLNFDDREVEDTEEIVDI